MIFSYKFCLRLTICSILIVPLSYKAHSNASGKATTLATPRSRASALDPENSGEDPTNLNAGTSVPGLQEGFKPKALPPVV